MACTSSPRSTAGPSKPWTSQARSLPSGTRPIPASSPASSTCGTATSSSRADRKARPPPPACLAYLPLATLPIMCIVRPSPRQAPGAWLRSMRTSISTTITGIDPTDWDALNPGGVPFLRHAFLAALETSGSVGTGTGWQPSPITLRDERGVAAAVPAYVKTHSMGEFVFDQAWAHAYAQHGLAYYPKLVLGVPFTPATGPRLLVRPDLEGTDTRAALIGAIREDRKSVV